MLNGRTYESWYNGKRKLRRWRVEIYLWQRKNMGIGHIASGAEYRMVEQLED